MYVVVVPKAIELYFTVMFESGMYHNIHKINNDVSFFVILFPVPVSQQQKLLLSYCTLTTVPISSTSVDRPLTFLEQSRDTLSLFPLFWYYFSLAH